MKKNSKTKNKSQMTPKVDPYLEGLMAKLLEHLLGLEKKMDVLIAQTAVKLTGETDVVKAVQNFQPKPPARREPTYYEAICADCQKICEVPFRPTEGRAVYCKECFAKRKAGGPGYVYVPPKPAVPAPKPVLKPVVVAPVMIRKPAPPKKTKTKKKK